MFSTGRIERPGRSSSSPCRHRFRSGTGMQVQAISQIKQFKHWTPASELVEADNGDVEIAAANGWLPISAPVAQSARLTTRTEESMLFRRLRPGIRSRLCLRDQTDLALRVISSPNRSWNLTAAGVVPVGWGAIPYLPNSAGVGEYRACGRPDQTGDGRRDVKSSKSDELCCGDPLPQRSRPPLPRHGVGSRQTRIIVPAGSRWLRQMCSNSSLWWRQATI